MRDRDNLAGVTVLVGEDDAIIGLDLVSTLEACGARVIGPVPTARSLCRLAAEADYDVAVFDVHLTDGVVFPAAEAAVDRGRPIVFCSGDFPAQELKRAFPTSSFFRKPYAMDAVCACVAAVCGNSGARERDRQPANQLMTAA